MAFRHGSRPLTASLLNLIMTLQKYRNFLIAETNWDLGDGFVETGWTFRLKQYFDRINDDRLEKHGLGKNVFSFEALLSFQVTPAMLDCEMDKLNQFSFHV